MRLMQYFCFFIAATFSLMCFASDNVQPLDGIVAIVNNKIILQSQLNKQLRMTEYQLKQNGMKLPPEQQLADQALQRLIDNKLQLLVAENAGVTVTNTELNETIVTIAARNHMSVSQLRDQIVKTGVSYKDYRKTIRDQLLINIAERHEVGPKVNVSPQEINSYYDNIKSKTQHIPEFHLKAILVPVPEAPTPDQVDSAKAKADAIVKQLQNGGDFNKIAITHSAGERAFNGGDLGWLQLAQMPQAVAQVVYRGQPGSVIGPVQTSNGFYIVKYLARRTVPLKHYVIEAHIRHILIKVSSLTTGKQAKEKLEYIRSQLLKGVSFTKLAKQYSQDLNSATKGGDLGWIKLNELAPQLAAKVVHLKIGEPSEPIYTNDGYELIEVLATQKINNTEAYLKDRIKQMIFQRKYQQAVLSWVQQLRGDAYIKVFPPYHA